MVKHFKNIGIFILIISILFSFTGFTIYKHSCTRSGKTNVYIMFSSVNSDNGRCSICLAGDMEKQMNAHSCCASEKSTEKCCVNTKKCNHKKVHKELESSSGINGKCCAAGSDYILNKTDIIYTSDNSQHLKYHDFFTIISKTVNDQNTFQVFFTHFTKNNKPGIRYGPSYLHTICRLLA